MATRLKNLDRDTPMLLPPDLRDWMRDDHIVHFAVGIDIAHPNIRRLRSLVYRHVADDRGAWVRIARCCLRVTVLSDPDIAFDLADQDQ